MIAVKILGHRVSKRNGETVINGMLKIQAAA